jgi:uncharacterized protein YbjT (DUF2867 family)
MILVTGATGNVGRVIVTQLHATGEHVRALTRNPQRADFPDGVDVVRGDLSEPETLPAALAGVDRAFLFPLPETVPGFLAVAEKFGLRRTVVLSSLATTMPSNPIGERHRTVEQAVEQDSPEWTHVRPGAFATNSVMWWRDSIRAQGVVRAPYGEAQFSPIHEADIAAVATAALVTDEHVGQKYALTGPESLTQREQVALIGSAIGKDIRFEELTPEEAEERDDIAEVGSESFVFLAVNRPGVFGELLI